MRKLLFFIVLTAMGMGKGLSQSLIQTYVDRCTGEVKVFTVPMNGQATVVFYNKAKTFTSSQFQNGELQAWLEETYLWWAMLNPCSTTTVGTTSTQQVTQQTTQQATQAATNAVASTPNISTNVTPPTPSSPPPTTETPPTSTPVTTDTSQNTTEVPTTEGTSTVGSEGTSAGDTGGTPTSKSTSQQDSQPTEATSTEETSTTDQNSESSSTEETQSEEVSTEESTTEETTEESSNEESNESEEEATEEQSEESDESSEEESEEKESEEESESDEDEKSEDEDTEEESDDETEEKDGKKKKKKRDLSPPIVTANVLSQQDPTGKFTQAASFGLSQSSLLGTETYGLNAMVYSNLQQFMLTANYSKVHINKEGRINRVYSASLGAMKMYSTIMGMMNHSVVWLGEKGSVKGLAFGTSFTSVELDIRGGLIYYDTQILGTSLTGFYTKSFTFDRLTLSPMLAVSNPFMSYDTYYHDLGFSKDVMFIAGNSFTYSLTQRFAANLGINAITATIKDFPVIWSFTIGSKFSF